MKVLLNALLCSASLEILSLLLPFGGRIGLGFLPKVTVALHSPALLLANYSPVIGETVIGPVLLQWLIWFACFVLCFSLLHRFRRRRPLHARMLERHASASNEASVRAPAVANDTAERDMLLGGLWYVGGLTVTVGTYFVASSAGGGKFVIAYGAIAYGAFRFLRGLFKRQ